MDRTLSEFMAFFIIIASSIINIAFIIKGVAFQNDIIMATIVFTLSLIIGSVGMIHIIIMSKGKNEDAINKKENNYDN